MNDRILVISRGLPPTPTGSSVIVGNLARQFCREEMVLLGELPASVPSVGWEPTWPDRLFLASCQIDGRRGARFRRWLQLPQMLVRTLRVARRYNCTAILAVFPREEHLFLGWVAARHTGAAYFPYLHNTYVEQRTGLGGRIARMLQPRFFSAAAHVFVMSEGMVELYAQRYPGLKCSALVHSFNEPIPAFVPPPPPGSNLRCVFSGSVNESCRDAAARLCTFILRTPRTELTLFTGTSRGELDAFGIPREGLHCETVSRDRLLARLRESDVVLLPHGFSGSAPTEEYQTIFPTKTIEYLISGRPILAHAPADSFVARFLRRHECALVVDRRDEGELRTALERLRTDADLRARLVRNALQAAAQFQAPTVAAEFRRHLPGAKAGVEAP